MIDIRKLKELVRLMVENDLTELNLDDQQETVTIKRGGTPGAMPVIQHMPAAMPQVYAAPAQPQGDNANDAPERPEPARAESDAGLTPVNSPMVGTAYLAANPESPAFVKVGDTVGPDTTVCLIEAMKVFSEIKAEVAGVVERIVVSNGQAVQYGQALVMVRPS